MHLVKSTAGTPLKVAVLGCGLIGDKRSKQLGVHKCVGVYDPDQARSEKLAKDLNTKAFASEDALLNDSDCDVVIVATTNNALAPMALKAVRAGKHVLVEKPAAIRLSELEELNVAAKEHKVAVKVGFNHRFHPAMLKARELIDAGALGELMFLRARYGHGGRLGYEKEWRSLPEIGGGGELLDQGVHLLDLIYWYMGPLPLQSSFVNTSYWNMKVDDNAVLTLANSKGVWATFHVSCSEWKNTFSLEIYGRTGKILVSGIGRSYGKEILTYYKMLPEMGPPEVQVFDFETSTPSTSVGTAAAPLAGGAAPGLSAAPPAAPADNSWALDMANLVEHIETGAPLLGDLKSAYYALEQVRRAYQANGFDDLPVSR